MRSIYHPPQVDIISKIYHTFREERISLKKLLEKSQGVFLAPPVGLEPTTCGLTVRRSTD